jgi:hypothetical protein
MRKGLLGSVLVLLAGAGLSFGQYAPPLSAGHGPEPMPVWAANDGNAFPWGGGGGDGGHAPCFWAGAEYLLWWFKGQPLPPFFVLTGDQTTANPGEIGPAGGGIPLANHSRVDYGALSGVRATVGGLLGGDGGLGIEGSGFILPRQSKTLRYASDANGNPVLAFRYQDPPGGERFEDAFQASIPAPFNFTFPPTAGSLAIVSNTRLWGSEVNAVAGLGGSGLRLQALGGFRYLDLSESVSLQLQSTAIDGGFVSFLGNQFGAGNSIASNDFFRTRNQFYGGQFGARGEFGSGGLVIAVTSKLALGNMHEVVEVRGNSTLVTDTGVVTTVPSGQFAGPSNIGRRTHDDFAVVPEFEIKVGYQVTSCLRATIGYDFLYVSRVVRPGSQIDLVVDDTANPVNGGFVAGTTGTAFPRPLFNRTDFWAQGLTFGIELTF